MLYLLRHIAFRGWTTLFVGGLSCLWILPFVQPYTGLSWILPLTLVILLLVYLVVGGAMNRYALGQVENILAEASLWERAGRTRDADNAYRKAVALFDSFLLSPRAQRQKSAHLVAQLARFYLARADKNHSTEVFVGTYLRSHPEDRDVAENWLRHLKNIENPSETDQALALGIGEAQPDNPVVQELLARFYLSYARTDFAALQTYRRVLRKNDAAIDDIVMALAAIFLSEGRCDEWALEIYLKAHWIDRRKSALKNGIAAGLHWIPETADNQPLLAQARAVLADATSAQIQTMISGFNPPVVQRPARPVRQRRTRTFALASRRLYRQAVVVSSDLWKSASRAFGAGVHRFSQLRRSRRTRLVLKSGFLAVLAAGLGLLLLNTAGYLLKSRPVAEKEKITAAITSDPFTLQVAAYLKPEHAEKYVAYLKKQKLEAYWKMAEGKNRRWYQVRVSHFADKESAIAYGKSLKERGLIDDFYVANYTDP